MLENETLNAELQAFIASVAGATSPWPVLELVPHGVPMSLLDAVISVSDNALMASVRLHSQSMFAEAEGVPALVGIEYMAQAIAAFAGYQALSQGGQVSLGFLVGTRKFLTNVDFFAVDSRLWIRVERVVSGDNGLSVFECAIKGENVDLSANLNVFQPANPEEFLAQA
ncbi:hotdog family protein [Simiduia litorea]